MTGWQLAMQMYQVAPTPLAERQAMNEIWRDAPPDKPGKWWMLCGEVEGVPELVSVQWRGSELWAVNSSVGDLPVKMYHDGLTECVWQPAVTIRADGVTRNEVADWKQMRDEGLSAKQIGLAVGRTERTVRRYLTGESIARV